MSAELRIYECAICRGRWFQRSGTDPQTHVRNCPNFSEGDCVAASDAWDVDFDARYEARLGDEH